MKDKGEIIIYQSDATLQLEVRMEGETVWLSLNQIAELFERDKSVISRHIKNVFEEKELCRESVVAKIATTTQHRAMQDKTETIPTNYYNLDAIFSVGYRVNSIQATRFRIWAI